MPSTNAWSIIPAAVGGGRGSFKVAPACEETELMSAYLEQRQSSPVDGLQQLVWALVNNPEFRFNH